MAENRGGAAAAGSGDLGATIKSEKSKDIRSTNIIAAKGKSVDKVTCHRSESTPRLPKHVHLIVL